MFDFDEFERRVDRLFERAAIVVFAFAAIYIPAQLIRMVFF